jgi:hypothetical protein
MKKQYNIPWYNSNKVNLLAYLSYHFFQNEIPTIVVSLQIRIQQGQTCIHILKLLLLPSHHQIIQHSCHAQNHEVPARLTGPLLTKAQGHKVLKRHKGLWPPHLTTVPGHCHLTHSLWELQESPWKMQVLRLARCHICRKTDTKWACGLVERGYKLVWHRGGYWVCTGW